MERKHSIVRAGLMGLLVGLGGCSHLENGGMFAGKSGAVVAPADFVGSEPLSGGLEAARPHMPVTPVGEPVRVGGSPLPVLSIGGSNTDPRGGTPTTASPLPLTTTVGTPPRVGAAAQQPGRAVVIDAVVGQVNGRPVFATEILEPLDGRLRALNARSLAEWQAAASHEAIEPELYSRIKDELILSEARQGLSSEQRQGLLHFLGEIQGSLISRSQGSEVKADETLRDQTGRTLKREAEDIRDQALIKHEIDTKVMPRVSVPWRDVQSEYERQHDKYHPPAQYTFRMIYTGSDKAANIAKIQEAMGAGKGFAEIAGMPCNDYIPGEKGKMERVCAGAQAECAFSDWPEINSAMRSLRIGQSLGPIVFAPDRARPGTQRIAWVHLERVDRPEAVSLYDAQLDIENDLRNERLKAEQRRYFERLLKRGNISNLELMVGKLVDIATERYASRLKGN
jgi:hypothetical protein